MRIASSPVPVLALCAALWSAAPAGAKPRPDLTIASVTATLDSGRVRVALDVRNRGATRAPGSALTVALRGATTIETRRSLRAVRTRRTVRLTLAVAPGAWRVVACADGTRRIRERDERN